MNRTYDYQSHWKDNEGKKPVEQKNWFPKQVIKLHEMLKNRKFSSVLEIGCGDGRITKELLKHYNIETYDAVDISLDRIENAKNNVENLKGICSIQFFASSFQEFSSEKKYDLVIAAELLMHVPDDEISSFIRNMIQRSKKYVMNIDYFPEEGFEWPKLKDRNYLHNYLDLFITSGIKPENIHMERIFEKQVIFCAHTNEQNSK